MLSTVSLLGLLACVSASPGHVPNSTFENPIFPGFYPDPSCIHVPERDNTFFCASSSFNAFPGIPIHASKDLQNWKLIGHALNRPEQLPRLAETNRSTSGIWAPTIRFHDDTFWIVTTLVNDDLPQDDSSRWDNIIFKSTNPYDDNSWSNAVHFNATGYDTSPYWDDDGKVYIVGAHAWHVGPWIQQAEVNLETGEVGEWRNIWNGTGAEAPEGPHIYRKDGWYYLLAAEGGTGLDHMVTMARSKSISGPYESNPANPVLTNANTTSYFQTVGHADLFQDCNGNWWAVALSTRSGPEYFNYPMGRETVMTAVSWPEGEWPIFTPVSGDMSVWPMPQQNLNIPGSGPFANTNTPDHLTFPPHSTLPPYLVHWRFPIPTSYTVSPPEKPNTLRLNPSTLNLTALNGNYAGPSGQTFIGQRQQHTLFTYSVDLDLSFVHTAEEEEGLEAGVTVFLTQNHHLDLGVVLLPAGQATATGVLNETSTATETAGVEKGGGGLVPYVRFRGESYLPVPAPVVVSLPEAWRAGDKLTLEIRASNATHYVFSVGPAGARSLMRDVLEVDNGLVSWGFTGTLLGIYATSNGGNATTPAYFSDWRYIPQGQFRD